MTGIISRIRGLAPRHDSMNWTQADSDLCWGTLNYWRDDVDGIESLDDFDPNEWALFCLFVAEALEHP